jgi:hypothetical protein
MLIQGICGAVIGRVKPGQITADVTGGYGIIPPIIGRPRL